MFNCLDFENYIQISTAFFFYNRMIEINFFTSPKIFLGEDLKKEERKDTK